MKVIFIGGKYRGSNPWEVELNIRAAEHQAFKIAEVGAAYICPHANSRFFDGTLTDEFWLKMTQELLTKCDAMYVCPGWQTSEGTIAEVELAKSLNIPVFETIEGIKNYAKED